MKFEKKKNEKQVSGKVLSKLLRNLATGIPTA